MIYILELLFLLFILNIFFIRLYLGNEINKYIIIIFIPLILLTTFRIISWDLISYLEIYNSCKDGLNFFWEFSEDGITIYEPMTYFIAMSSQMLGIGFRGFLFLYLLITLVLLFFSIKLYKVSYVLAISLYMIIFFIPGPHEAIRAALSAIMLLVTFYYSEKKQLFFTLISFFIALITHYSAIFFLGFLLLFKLSKHSNLVLFLSITLSMAFLLLFPYFYETLLINSEINNILFAKLNKYLTSDRIMIGEGLTEIFLYYSMLLFLFVNFILLMILNMNISFLDNIQRNLLKFLMIVSIFSLIVYLNQMSVFGGRLYHLLCSGEVIVLSKVISMKSFKYKKLLYSCLFIIFLITLSNILLTFKGSQSINNVGNFKVLDIYNEKN